MDPHLDVLTPPYEKWAKGTIVARQTHFVRTLQNPNKKLFLEDAEAAGSSTNAEAAGSVIARILL